MNIIFSAAAAIPADWTFSMRFQSIDYIGNYRGNLISEFISMI